MRKHLTVPASALGVLVLAGSLTACAPASEETSDASPTTVSEATVDEEAAADEAAADEAATDEAATAIDGEHNQADVDFVQQMIPHHEQAVMMSAMAEQRAATDGLRQLAADIEAAQGPEIDRMRAMLEAWGEEPGGMAGMDMGGHGMDGMDGMVGMMSEERMGALEGSDGAAFDRMWLEGMVEHHEGAIEMSRTQVQEGLNPQAIELAEQIAADQEAEIALMEQMLADL